MTWVGKKGYASTKRIPVGILCDISSSMEDVQDILNRCIVELVNKLKKSPKLKMSVDLLLIFFNGDIDVKVNFQKLESVNPEMLKIQKVTGYTDTGYALLEALRLLKEKKNEYKVNELNDYWQPILFLITDGYPVPWKGAPDSAYEEVAKKYKLAAEEIRLMEGKEQLSFVAAGIQRTHGSSANMKKLRELTNNVICISEDISDMHNIEDFFRLIGATVVYRETDILDLMHEPLGKF